MADSRLDAYRELRDPRQIKAFGSPLRLRIIHVLIRRPATNQQIAAELGEPPAKIYHHVCSLLDAGVIRLVDTRISGKNVEKFYRAVARSFILRPRENDLPDMRIGALGAALDRVQHEALGSAATWEDDPPRLLRQTASLSPQRLDAFHEQLHRLIQEYWTGAEEQGDEVPRRVLTVLTHREAPNVPDESEKSSGEWSDA